MEELNEQDDTHSNDEGFTSGSLTDSFVTTQTDNNRPLITNTVTRPRTMEEIHLTNRQRSGQSVDIMQSYDQQIEYPEEGVENEESSADNSDKLHELDFVNITINLTLNVN